MIFIPTKEDFRQILGSLDYMKINSGVCMSQCTGCKCSCKCSCSSPNTLLNW